MAEQRLYRITYTIYTEVWADNKNQAQDLALEIPFDACQYLDEEIEDVTDEYIHFSAKSHKEEED